MPYLLLILEERDRRRSRSPEQRRREYEGMGRFVDDLKHRGVHLASESLKSLSEGVRIAVRGGKRVVADGPFAEAKEMVGGFFLLDCQTRAEAVALANECPATEWATVEVRELGPCYED
jgi:hypothetical protein